jgi:hypothetical protein
MAAAAEHTTTSPRARSIAIADGRRGEEFAQMAMPGTAMIALTTTVTAT